MKNTFGHSNNILLFGSSPTKGETLFRLIETLGNRAKHVDESFSCETCEAPPSMMIYVGEQRKDKIAASSKLIPNTPDLEQIQISNWLDKCLQFDKNSKFSPYFVALCESMDFDNQMKALRLRDFSFIKPSLGYFQCLSELTRCRTCQAANKNKREDTSREKTNQNEINIVVVDANIPTFEPFSLKEKLPAINLVQVDGYYDLLQEQKKLNIDLIAVNLSLQNIDIVNLIKLINQNLELASKPLILFGEHKYQKLVINNQLNYDRLIITPFSTEELCSSICQSLIESTRSTEMNDLLEINHQAQIHLEATIDSHALVSKTDNLGRITYVNEKFCTTSQFEVEELLGNTHSLINSGYHENDFFTDMWQTISKGKVWHGLVCNRKKDGTLYWVDSTICPLPVQQNYGCSSNKQRYNYLSIRTEITDTMINKERLTTGQSFANIGTWDWNINTGEVSWSERVGYLFGYDESVPITKYDAFFNSIHPEDKELVNKALADCLDEGKSYRVEHRILTPGGEIRWLSEKGDVVRDKSGKPSHLVGVVQDITRSKVAENNMKTAMEKAEKSSLAKSEFLASMSHELRTPMNAILGFTQLLEMDKDSSLTVKQKENLSEISNASGHLLKLIEQLLNMSEIESGKINLSIGKVDVATIILECLSMLHPLIIKMKINFEFVFENELVEKQSLSEIKLFARADLVRLKQILINLLSNACKYNQVGGLVRISLCAEKEDIKIGVVDTGKGMGLAEQERIFEPFERLGAEQSDIEGTGIGLVITKQLVELMGGDLSFSSQLGRGSEFYFTVPIDERRYIERDDSIQSTLEQHKREMTAKTYEPKKIFYVEDNPTNLRLVSQLIGRIPNTELFSAHNAEVGIKLIKKTLPDLILMDINLPGMSGTEALNILKENSKTNNIPILAISANAMADDIEKALSEGFESYITKPIDVIKITKTIKKYLKA